MEQDLIQIVEGYIKALEQKKINFGLNDKEKGMLSAYVRVLNLNKELHNEE